MRLLKNFGTFYFILSFINCSGQPLISEVVTQSLSVEVSHSGTQDDTGVSLNYSQADGSKVFQNDLGVTVTLTRAGLSWSHLHLISEGDDEECEPGFDAELDLNVIEDIMSDDASPLSLVTGEIEDRAYCRYEIHLSGKNIASNGILNLTQMLGNAVYLAGSWNDGASSADFEIALEDDVEILGTFQALEDGVAINHPLHFHDGESQEIIFLNLYDRWFDGIDFTETKEVLESELLVNITQTFRQQLQPGSVSEEDQDHSDHAH